MSLRFLSVAAAAAGLLLASCSTPPEPAPRGIGPAKRVLVVGDSITYDGHYVEYVEEALLLGQPKVDVTFLDVALPSETVSGLSEAGHAGGKFPRPDLHERLARVLAKVKPDLIIASYGENDGIYEPFSEERFVAFQRGILWLRAQAEAAHARVIHLTPCGFDPRPIWNKVAPAGRETATAPYAGYDEVLARYSQWLVDQRAQGWDVIDVHAAFGNALAAHRLSDPNFSYTKDGVHPNPEGHAVIAGAILSAWGYPPDLVKAPLAWAAHPDALTTAIRERNSVLKDAWLTATGHQRPGMKTGLPLPEAEKKAAELTQRIEALAGAGR